MMKITKKSDFTDFRVKFGTEFRQHNRYMVMWLEIFPELEVLLKIVDQYTLSQRGDRVCRVAIGLLSEFSQDTKPVLCYQYDANTGKAKIVGLEAWIAVKDPKTGQRKIADMTDRRFSISEAECEAQKGYYDLTLGWTNVHAPLPKGKAEFIATLTQDAEGLYTISLYIDGQIFRSLYSQKDVKAIDSRKK